MIAVVIGIAAIEVIGGFAVLASLATVSREAYERGYEQGLLDGFESAAFGGLESLN